MDRHTLLSSGLTLAWVIPLSPVSWHPREHPLDDSDMMVDKTVLLWKVEVY